jgi:DNA-binding NtrC family response regulator
LQGKSKFNLRLAHETLVFVVDTDYLIASTLAIILQQTGFETKFFTDPQEALQAVRTEAPRLLISEALLPQLSGIDLAILVQHDCPECKVLLTSYLPDAAHEMVEAARAVGYEFELLSKPVDPAKLLIKVQDMIGCASRAQRATDD